MSYAKSRKHHRVAKKSIENNSVKGIFIPNEYKNKICILTFVLFNLVMITGIIIGYFISNNND